MGRCEGVMRNLKNVPGWKNYIYGQQTFAVCLLAATRQRAPVRRRGEGAKVLASVPEIPFLHPWRSPEERNVPMELTDFEN